SQREVELLVEAGFTPLEALKIASANGAEYLGITARTGTIAVGKSADLVVMSTHAREPVSRFWLGSVADRLSRTIPVPLLLLPQGAGHWGQGFRRILVTLDGSPLAESALEPACMIGRLFGASLRLVHVVEPAVSQVDLAGVLGAESVVEMERQGREWGLTYLSRVAGQLQAAQTEVTTRVISAPTVATGVLSEAADGIDLIAIASHGRGGFRRLILGSVADKIIRGSPVPVLLCHDTGKD
ncbi:MAG: universal stress protein, partial [Gemmatimonadota bacterium]